METEYMLIERIGRQNSFECKKYIIDGSNAVMMGDSADSFFVGVIIAGLRVDNSWDTTDWSPTPRIFTKTHFRFVSLITKPSEDLPLGLSYAKENSNVA